MGALQKGLIVIGAHGEGGLIYENIGNSTHLLLLPQIFLNVASSLGAIIMGRMMRNSQVFMEVPWNFGLTDNILCNRLRSGPWDTQIIFLHFLTSR